VANLHNALRLLGRRASQVRIVGVSTDPRGDTRQAVPAFLARHEMTGRVQYLTGSRAALVPVWRAWGINASKPRAKATEDTRRRGTRIELEPIGLHECRHTYASFLMATGSTLRELMEYMSHSSLQATERYVKLLPQPAGPDGAADRLNAYLAQRSTRS
jgi:integrase